MTALRDERQASPASCRYCCGVTPTSSRKKRVFVFTLVATAFDGVRALNTLLGLWLLRFPTGIAVAATFDVDLARASPATPPGLGCAQRGCTARPSSRASNARSGR